MNYKLHILRFAEDMQLFIDYSNYQEAANDIMTVNKWFKK